MTPDQVCDAAVESLRQWEEFVVEARRITRDLDEVSHLVKQAARGGAEVRISPAGVERMEDTTSYHMNVSGYMRYLDKETRLELGTELLLVAGPEPPRSLGCIRKVRVRQHPRPRTTRRLREPCFPLE